MAEDYSIFYIGHIVHPFLFYCLTKNYLIPILIVVLWEVFEYILFSTFGNYTPLYLETENSVQEDLENIMIYDIGGGFLAVYVAFTLYYYFEIKEPIIKLDFFKARTWRFCLLFIVRALILAPFSSVGWECVNTSDILAFFCPEDGEYNTFAWGLIGLFIIDTLYVWYMFKDDRKQMTIVLIVVESIMLTGVQRAISGIVLTFWALVIVSSLMAIYWVVLFIQKCRKLKDVKYDSVVIEVEEREKFLNRETNIKF